MHVALLKNSSGYGYGRPVYGLVDSSFHDGGPVDFLFGDGSGLAIPESKFWDDVVLLPELDPNDFFDL